MLDVEVFGARLAPGAPPPAEIRSLCTLTAASRGVHAGHVAIEFTDPKRIAELNSRHRGERGPTDVLSFPIDGVDLDGDGDGDGDGDDDRDDGDDGPVPRELGDVVICPEHTHDLREAIVHGMLHLLGMDHERDDGEMLALQRRLLSAAQG